MMARNTPLLFRQRGNVKSDFRRGKHLGAKDHVIGYPKPKHQPVWLSEDEYAALPDQITIREFSVKGLVYVTTLREAKAYPKTALAELYQQRLRSNWILDPSKPRWERKCCVVNARRGSREGNCCQFARL